MANNTFTPFNVKEIIKNQSIIRDAVASRDGAEKGIVGTAIPYLQNLYSDIIINPCSVSIAELQKMVVTQPIISNSITILNNLIKNEIGNFQHENAKYTTFINCVINNLRRPLNDLLNEMLSGIYFGFYVGEKVEAIEGRYKVIKDIEPRPAMSIVFRVDSQGHLKDDGVIQYWYNNFWTGYGNMLSNGYLTPNNYNYPNPYASYGDLNYPLRTVWTQTFGATILPARTRFLFSYQSNTGMNSPYGVPLLRSAYDYYLINTELNRIMVNAANFKASPIPVLIINPNQMSTDNGDTALDSVGNALSTLGDSGKANPFLLLQGTKDSISIEQLNTTANLTDLTYMRKYIDSMILTSLGFPSDLAGLSDKGSYGLGKAQQDLLSRTVNAMAKQLKEALIRQFVRPMLEDNFGEREDFGSFSQVDTEQQHIDTNLKIITTLREQGIKLKSDSIMSLVNIDKDAIESENNPIVDIDDSRDPFGAFRGLGD